MDKARDSRSGLTELVLGVLGEFLSAKSNTVTSAGL